MGNRNLSGKIMSKMITGSLCLTELLAKAKEGHSAFTKADNGKIYFNILVWENDEPDKFNNNFSVQLNPKKDAPESEKKQYIGNMKHVASNAQPVQAGDLDVNLDSLPIAGTQQKAGFAMELPEEPEEKLPF